MDALLLGYAPKFAHHQSILQHHLGVKIESRPVFDIFKLSDGDGIGFHDDADIPCLRLAGNLHQNKLTSVGGHFLMSNGALNSTYVIDLEIDTGVAFFSGAGKLHSVSNVRGTDAIFLIAQYNPVAS
jgi:hypothetical protein